MTIKPQLPSLLQRGETIFLQPTLGTGDLRQMGTSNSVFRLPVRFHQSPTRTPQGDLHTASQGQRQAQGAAARSQPAPPQECGRGHTRADSFPLSLLPYNEEIGRLATYRQPQETQQIHQATSVQDGVASSRPPRTTTQLVGRQSRPEGCLPPHSHPSFFQKMAGFRHRRRELPLQVSPIRTLHGSSDIHQDGQSHSRTSQEARRVRLYLPRRLATDSTISRDPARSGSHGLRPSAAAGLHRQLPEVDASTLPEGKVPRVAPGLYERNGVPHRRTSPECNPLCSSTTSRGDTSSPSLDENAGPHRQPQVYATSEHPTNASHPAGRSRQIQKPQRQSLPQDQQDNAGLQRPLMVDSAIQCSPREEICSATTSINPNHGCIQGWMGSTLGGHSYPARGLLLWQRSTSTF